MTYNAGDIQATADLNRDPFLEGLRYCLEQGRQFGRQTFTATAAINDQNARRQLAQLQIMMRRMSEESVDIDVNADTSEAIGELEALRAAQARVGSNSTTTSRTLQKNTEADKKEFQLLRVAIEQLGPPLIPLAGGLLGASTAAVGLGAAGILAFKGIQSEIKSATPLGQQFAGGIRVIQGDLTVLERTSARGVLAGFQSSIVKVNQALPAFNANMAVSSKNLGDIGSHLVGGLIGGFNTFTPLIEKAEGYVDHLAQKFESWATGPGGAKFASTLSTDLDHAIPALANLATTAEHLVAAFHPVGLGMLDTLSNLSDILNHIPVGVLQAAATAYIAFRTAVTVTTGIEAAAAALDKLAVSETAAATAGTAAAAGGWSRATLYGSAANASLLQRTAGGIAGVTRAIIPYAAAYVGAAVALNAASSATEKWRRSTDATKSTFANITHAASQMLTSYHWGSILSGAIGDQSAGLSSAALTRQLQSGINATGAGVPTLASIAATAQATSANKAQLASMDALKQKMESTVSTVNRLSAANRVLAAAGETQTLQYARNRVAIDMARAAGDAAAVQYAKLKASTDTYTMSLKAEAAANAVLARTRDTTAANYAISQGAHLGSVETQAFAQNPTLTAGVAGLQQYAKVVAQAQKAEESWTKVDDDATVTIKGHTYETKAFNAALALTGNNYAKAEGLMLGHTKALADDKVAAQGAADMQTRLSTAIGAAENKYTLNDQQLNEYASLLGITSEKLATGEISQAQFVAAIGRVKDVVDGASQSLSGWITAVGQFQQGTDTAASRGQLLAQTMIAFNGSAISYGVAGSAVAAANQQFVTSFDAAKKGVVNLKTGFIDFHNAGSQPLLSALSGLQTAAGNFAAATYQDEVSTRGRTQAAKDAASVYYNDTHNALDAEAKQLGITKGQADKLADRYFHWPTDARTQLELMGVEGTNKLLNGLGDQLSILTGKPWLASLGADTKPALSKAAQLQARLDAIKQNKVPGLDVHSNAARAEIEKLQAEIDALHGKSINLNVTTLRTIETATRSISNPSGSAAGNIFQFSAGGTTQKEDHRPAIYKAQPGAVRVFAEPETDWEAYIPGANDWRRPRAKAIAQETVSKLGGVAYFESGGFTGVTGGGGSGGGSGSSGKAAPHQSGGSKSPTPASASQKWYFYDGLYYQGLQAYNEAVAAHNGGAGYGIGAYGSGKNRGYGTGGTGYGTYIEAFNARSQTVTETLKPLEAAAKSELAGIDTQKEVTRLAKESADQIRTQINKIDDTLVATYQAKAIPWSFVAQFRKDNSALNTELNTRDALVKKLSDLNDKLKTAQQQLATDQSALLQYSQGIASNFLNALSLTNTTDAAGNTLSGSALAASFQTSLTSSVTQAQKMLDDITQARAAGLNPDLLQSFEQSGPAGQSTLEAILGSGNVSSISNQYQQLLDITKQVGTESGKDDKALNDTIATDNKTIIGIQNQIAQTTKDEVTTQKEINSSIGALRTDIQGLPSKLGAIITDALRKSQ